MVDRGKFLYGEIVPYPHMLNIAVFMRIMCLFIFFFSLIVISTLVIFFNVRNLGLVLVVILAEILILFAYFTIIKNGLFCHIPIRTYENGIEFPATYFEKKLLGKGFIERSQIEVIYPKKNKVRQNDVENLYPGLNEIIIITKNGKIHRSSLKSTSEINNILEVLQESYKDKLRMDFKDKCRNIML